ncbi:hypothetical protein KK083_31710 [Fulvivirgaceae bacterium PWU4]|uniref:Uncharacterized protein n=1 Tax=Chryseosolibacter histidini TaxID=2782349 RepID=A0AAP2DV12_9BACT|nr:hypothetical protein [Chryseosolibacter histidini]MBT1701502.1 hypothetical protein [Chryseosolibacter histidini]
MEKKHILIFIGCLLSVTLVMVALYASSPINSKIFRANFDRKLLPETALEEKNAFELEASSVYISGVTADKIYISNTFKPLNLWISDYEFKNTHDIRLKLVGVDSLREPSAFRTTVDPPNFFLSNGIMPIAMRGTIDSWEAKKYMPDSSYYFVEAVPISTSSMALKSYSSNQQALHLARKTAIDTPYFKFKYGLLEKQKDGVFCVNGKLHFSKDLHKLIYLYAYRNQYIVMDTNMNLSYRGNTIDTFSVARVKLTQIESKKLTMAASPPTVINGLSCVSKNYLYNQSLLLANNEDEKVFKKSAVIDVYDINQGIYVFSFHVPKYRNNSLSDFRVFNNQLIALFGRHLVVYELNNNNVSINEDFHQ